MPDSRLFSEEIFGPVAALSRVDTLDEAVALMHEVSYGNAASIFTTSGRVIERPFAVSFTVYVPGITHGELYDGAVSCAIAAIAEPAPPSAAATPSCAAVAA